MVSSISPKKQMNKFIVVVSKLNSFVCFLGEFEDTKSPFQIIWPLEQKWSYQRVIAKKKVGKYPLSPKGFRHPWVPIISILQEQPIHAKTLPTFQSPFFHFLAKKTPAALNRLSKGYLESRSTFIRLYSGGSLHSSSYLLSLESQALIESIEPS